MYGTELSSPMHSFTHASMLPLPAPRLGNIQDAWPTLGRPAGILGHFIPLQGFQCMRRYATLLLGHSSSFKSPAPISMRKHCLHCSKPITRSHASRETTPSAASLFVCVQRRRISQRRVRKIYASSGCNVPVAPAGTTRICNPNVLASILTLQWRWHAAQSKRSVKGFPGL